MSRQRDEEDSGGQVAQKLTARAPPPDAGHLYIYAQMQLAFQQAMLFTLMLQEKHSLNIVST